MNQMKRMISMLLSASLVISMLAGCSGGSPGKSQGGGTSGSGTSAEVREDLNFGMTVEPISMNPYMVTDSGSFLPITQVFDTLILEDANGDLVPSLAESWVFSDDRTEITFKLKDGVKFHNGETMTAEDVAYSLNKSAASSYAAKITGTIEKAEVVGDLEVKVTLKYAYEPILSCLACAPASIVSKKAMEADEEGFGRNPVGTGAYQFVEWKNGESLSFVRFDDYFKGVPAIKDLTLKIYTDQNTAVYALENGEIDVLDNPPASELDNLRHSDKITLYETNSAMPVFVGFNNEKGAFANKELRQAVSYAINRDDIILGALEGNGVPLYVSVSPSAFGYPQDFQGTPYDVEKAKELMAQAGYPNGVTVTLKCTESPLYSKPAQIIQEELRQIGIDVKIDIMEKGAFLDDIYNNGDFEMCIWAIISMFPDADYTLYSRFHSKLLGGSNNFFRCQIPELDALLDQSRIESDPAQRMKIIEQACELIQDNAVMIPLFCGLNTVAADNNLKGVVSNSTSKYYIYDYQW